VGIPLLQITENNRVKQKFTTFTTNRIKFFQQNYAGDFYQMLKALVITPNNKTAEYGDLLAIARAEARKREHTEQNPPIRALRFFPEIGVYVAVYEATETAIKNVREKR
jgi:hypothetical protein